jgi:hypothetical protein
MIEMKLKKDKNFGENKTQVMTASSHFHTSSKIQEVLITIGFIMMLNVIILQSTKVFASIIPSDTNNIGMAKENINDDIYRIKKEDINPIIHNNNNDIETVFSESYFTVIMNSNKITVNKKTQNKKTQLTEEDNLNNFNIQQDCTGSGSLINREVKLIAENKATNDIFKDDFDSIFKDDYDIYKSTVGFVSL